jgi:predicted PurR-regulated permease PerM
MPLKPPTEQQSRIFWFALTGLAMAVMVALAVAAIWGLGRILNLLSPVLWPLAIAAVAACVLSPVVDLLEARWLRRSQAILLVFVMAFGLVVAAFASVIPRVVDETGQLAAKVPEYTQRLQDQVSHFLAEPPAFLRHFKFALPAGQDAAAPSQTAQGLLASATDWVKTQLPEVGSWMLKSLVRIVSRVGLLAGLVLIPVYAYYFLLEQRAIVRDWRDYLPLRSPGARAETIFVCEAIGQYLVAFFRGQLLVALCDAVLYTAGFLMVGLNYAFLLGLAAVLLIMIPFVGAMTLCASALLLAFVQFTDWLHPLEVLCVFGVVQSLESLVISPKIMGNRVGLHPLIIIIAVMTGTTLFGSILGGILAIPLAAVLRVILARYVWKAAEKTA